MAQCMYEIGSAMITGVVFMIALIVIIVVLIIVITIITMSMVATLMLFAGDNDHSFSPLHYCTLSIMSF